MSFVCTHCSIWSIDWMLSDATTPGQSGPGCSGNEEVLHISQISKAGASQSDGLMPYSGQTLTGGVLPFYRDAVCVFYSPGWLG